MDKASLNHLDFLKTIYPDLFCQVRLNPSLNVLVKPKVCFNPFTKGVVQTLTFDAVLSFTCVFDGRTNEYLMLIDENLSNGICDKRGVPYQWKSESLTNSGLTHLKWSYWHISGCETVQVAVSPTLDVPLSSNIAVTLQSFNSFVYGKYSCN